MDEIKDCVLPESECPESGDEAGVSQETQTNSENPFFQFLKYIDEKVSMFLSVSATKTSPLGYLRPYLKMLEVSCHGVPWITACVLCLWASSDADTEAFILNILFALFLDIILVAVFKCIFRRKRPKNNESDMFITLSIDKMSCPSGHTSRAVMMTLILMHKFPSLTLLHPFLILWCISTCASRVMLGRHFVGDVLIGAFLGLFEYHFMDMLWLDSEFCQWLISFYKNANVLLGDEL